MNWTPEQQQLLNLAESPWNHYGEQYFLTGKAGTGKTTVLKEFIKRVEENGNSVAKLATTGVAACLLGGQTIHSFFAVKPYNILTDKEIIYVKAATRKLWNQASVILIDEASMLRPDIVDFIELQLRKNNCRSLKTKLLIFSGDDKQLPSINDNTSKAYLLSMYDSLDFRSAHILSKLKTIELSVVQRQSDQEFIDNLNIVRDGKKTDYFDRFKIPSLKEMSGVLLCPYKWQADQYNEFGLSSLPGPVIEIQAEVSGDISDKDFLVPQLLRVKNGAKVMHLINTEDGLINGDVGTFIVENGNYFFKNHKGKFLLEKVKNSKFKYILNYNDQLELIEVGSITQLPIQLAWASTIHKAQGQTYSEVTIDMREEMFEAQQLYVALSRVTGPAGLKIVK